MNRFSVVSLTSTITGAILAVSPLAANAQPAPTAEFTPDLVRAQYIAHGYVAARHWDAAKSGDYASPPLSAYPPTCVCIAGR